MKKSTCTLSYHNKNTCKCYQYKIGWEVTLTNNSLSTKVHNMQVWKWLSSNFESADKVSKINKEFIKKHMQIFRPWLKLLQSIKKIVKNCQSCAHKVQIINIDGLPTNRMDVKLHACVAHAEAGVTKKESLTTYLLVLPLQI